MNVTGNVFGAVLGVVPLLILQVAAVLAVTNFCGFLLARLGQPRVVGEIAGGLVLGPLVFGHLFPAASAVLFPPDRLYVLEIVSNVGLVLFLFLIGAEVDLTVARRNRGASLAITFAGIALPFALGAAISPFLLARFGMPGASPLGFLLFTGIAVSITALPVLARMIQERARSGRPIDHATASTVLLSAAANDLIAWSLLAFALVIIHSNRGSNGNLAATLVRLLFLAAYIAIMLLVARPLASRLLAARLRRSHHQPPAWLWISGLVAFAFLSSRITEMLGVHAFFGAFFAGICVPRIRHAGVPVEHTLQRILQPVIQVTIPIFFAMTGLRTERDMFSGEGLGWLAVILLAAVVGKIGGAMLAARMSGMGWKTAAEIGILLNTRGLVELVILNIGYKEGLLSPLLFTLFVLMALITTAMTAPLFDLSNRLSAKTYA